VIRLSLNRSVLQRYWRREIITVRGQSYVLRLPEY
jgi:hypothetical protein